MQTHSVRDAEQVWKRKCDLNQQYGGSMSKYIKVDDLQEYCDHQVAHEITPNVFQRMNQIEIVRCKDCKHGKIYENCVKCENAGNPGMFATYHQIDWFCADGECKMQKCEG